MNQVDLKSIALNCANKIISADFNFEPYKHIVVDNFFPEPLAYECLKSFPHVDDKSWEHQNDKDIEIKSRSNWKSEFDVPENIIDVVRILNSSIILNAFSKVFNINKLIPDPYYSGGGLNITQRGGLLDVHVDGNYHDASGLHRRVNAILYLNPGWQEGWGGEFGLYDNNGEKLIKKIAPIHNRIVVFDTNDYSFHGLPDPLNFPDGKARRSIILYYYTKEPRPTSDINVDKPHSALWKKRGWLDKRGNKTRDFY